MCHLFFDTWDKIQGDEYNEKVEKFLRNDYFLWNKKFINETFRKGSLWTIIVTFHLLPFQATKFEDWRQFEKRG